MLPLKATHMSIRDVASTLVAFDAQLTRASCEDCGIKVQINPVEARHISQTMCFLTRNWLDQMTTTNRIISSQALIIIRSKRNTFIIRNQNKRKSSLYLVTKFKNFNINLLLWRVVTTVSLYGLADSPGKRIQRQKNDNKITSFSLRFC